MLSTAWIVARPGCLLRRGDKLWRGNCRLLCRWAAMPLASVARCMVQPACKRYRQMDARGGQVGSCTNSDYNLLKLVYAPMEGGDSLRWKFASFQPQRPAATN